MAAGEVEGANSWELGTGSPAVLCIHETGATGEVWRALATALESRARVIAYDRPGWGKSRAPATYLRTTVGEQAATAEGVLDARAGTPALVCGAGLGAVVALELLLRKPDQALGGVLVEPPLLAFVPEATDALAEAAGLVRDAVADGGRDLAFERFLTGGLGILSAGSDRLPEPARAGGQEAPASLFAELAAIPAWELPLAELGSSSRPAAIVTGAGTHPLIREAAAALARALARSELREVGPGLPHHDQATALADIVTEVAEA